MVLLEEQEKIEWEENPITIIIAAYLYEGVRSGCTALCPREPIREGEGALLALAGPNVL